MELYQSRLSPQGWTILTVAADLGWAAYLAGLVLAAGEGGPAGLFLVAAIGGLGIARGLWERIDEKKQGLRRILPRVRLYRGFGCLTLSSLVGAAAALAGYALAGGLGWVLTAAGGLVCGGFSLALLLQYKRI